MTIFSIIVSFILGGLFGILAAGLMVASGGSVSAEDYAEIKRLYDNARRENDQLLNTLRMWSDDQK